MPFIALVTLLIIAIFWLNNSKVYRALYVIANLALLTLIYNTFIIYLNNFSFSPWKDSGKVAYLVVVIEVLWLLAINVIMGLLNRKMFISANMLLLPFVSALILGLYLIFYVNPPIWLCAAGLVSSAFLFMALIVSFFANFEKSFKSE